MRAIFFIRVASVLAALFTASFISFPSFPEGIFSSDPISVNRALKGDRLPPVALGSLPHELGARPLERQTREKIPVGCDSAFSPVVSPRLANIFKRCMV
jgi:hypothetical protein